MIGLASHRSPSPRPTVYSAAVAQLSTCRCASASSPWPRRARRIRRRFLHSRAGRKADGGAVARPFATALDVSAHPALAEGLRARGLAVAEAGEDGLPSIGAPFDLVTSLGLLDTINDLPGALALIRRALKPDGLFLAAFAGAGSLPRLRRAMRAGEEAQGSGAAPRIHPQITCRRPATSRRAGCMPVAPAT